MGIVETSMDQPYDFPRVVSTARLAELVAFGMQLLCLYGDADRIGTAVFLFLVLIGFNFFHVFRRWYNNIDGRYDLRQLIAPNTNNTLRVQYFLAVATALLLGLFVHYCVPTVHSAIFHLFFALATYTQLAAAAVILGLETFEVVKNKMQ